MAKAKIDAGAVGPYDLSALRLEQGPKTKRGGLLYARLWESGFFTTSPLLLMSFVPLEASILPGTRSRLSCNQCVISTKKKNGEGEAGLHSYPARVRPDQWPVGS